MLLSLDAYFRQYEATAPDFVARVWLGDDFAGQHAFRGRTTEAARIDVPMAWLSDPGDLQDLVLAKEGPGRLYYRLGLRYAPTDLDLAPADRGFALQRSYEPIDEPGDVSRDDDGTWRVRAGASVRVRGDDGQRGPAHPCRPGRPPARRIRAQQPRARHHRSHPRRSQRAARAVLVVAAGVVRARQPARRAHRGVHLAAVRWRVRIHLRRHRHHPRTLRRAPREPAEEMYHPETFGRTATDRVIIE